MPKRWNLANADRKTIYGVSLIVCVLLVLLIIAMYLGGQTLEKSKQTVGARGDLGDRFADAPDVEYNGALYRPYEHMTNILVMGVDRYSTTPTPGISFRNGGQADYLLLLAINNDTQTITPIQIDRDTMAEITILGVLGDETGKRVTQICLSHGFGDGKEQSCLLTVKAVGDFLLGTEIDFYIAMEMDGIATLNDVLGGITVTLEDDFSAVDPAMVKGATLKLEGMQAETYVRGRMFIGAGTNQARSVRQQSFMDALSQRLHERLGESSNAEFIGEMFDTLDPYLVTDMKRGRMINEAWNTRNYAQLDTIHPQGQYSTGLFGFTEFRADDAALKDLVMNTFYYPAEADPPVTTQTDELR